MLRVIMIKEKPGKVEYEDKVKSSQTSLKLTGNSQQTAVRKELGHELLSLPH